MSPSDVAIMSNRLREEADVKGWFGLEIHIHLLPEQPCIPLQVMAVYKIKEEEK